MSSSMSSAYVSALKSCLNEDTHDAERRGEGTSKIETRFENEAAAAEQKGDEWLAAGRDGEVHRMQGEPNAAAFSSGPGETDLDALRKLRLGQLKERAAIRQRYLAMGHGQYARLTNEAEYLSKVQQHERMVMHLWDESLDCSLLHIHMEAMSKVHLETYFCALEASLAPMMMSMVEVVRLPVLLLCHKGKVVHQLSGVDRSFTTEGVAYEISQHKLLDFEEGTAYSRTVGGCTTQTAARGAAADDYDYDDLEDDEDD
eukprot:CAMPEP_0183358218 /NCGR_PEP_ID=MMETSP0164_2-20130417/48536_1 /TAXON_ID=221442 /ORGANISM="Coccolithus pelagicus ssp braarudi, Strain PLY182g" /LENGTH=257 /DNA_ID=CAMNT_0025532069 /DNA_START=19 /DNA_END=792 /DNA_ORIENTATION=+